MTFSDPQRIWATIDQMLQAGQPRSRNRARINAVFNGDPPYSEKEAEDNSVETNVNFLEGTELLHKARSQFNNAFLKPGRFFSVRLDVGPPFKRQEWGQTITTHINRAMKKSPRYFQTLQDKFAGVVLHGIGPQAWFQERDWCPKSHGIEDILVPTNTLRSFENLNYFAILTTFTAAELAKKTRGPNVDSGWNKSMVRAALEWLRENTSKESLSTMSEMADYPEKIEEDFKENAGFWNSDAAPVLRTYDFYYLDTDDKGEPDWRRKIVLDKNSQPLTSQKLADDIILYDGKKRSYGKDIRRILQCQFADGSVKPPFRYHSVRSLGYLLYAPVHLQNRLRCKFNDAVFESMLWYFRNVTTGDEERLQKIDLHHLGIIPDGLSFVPKSDRHTVDPELVGMAMTMNRQLMSEKSSSYVQDVDRGAPSREETATEVMAKVNASHAMIGSMLTEAYTYENYSHIEIARRFAVGNHEDCKRFRTLCMIDGVPPQVFKAWDAWEVITERTLGSGNKTLEIAQAERLMAIKDSAEISGDSKRRIVRLFIGSTTDDPAMAMALVPEDNSQPTSAQQMATLAWGTLIAAQPVVIAEAINPIDYVVTLLKMLDTELQRIEQSGGTPELPMVLGLANVIQHIAEKVQFLAQDKSLMPMVKQFMDALKNAGNLVKGYMQSLQAKASEQGQQMDPEVVAKIQALMLTAESKARIAEENASLKRRQKEIAFVQEQNRKNDALAAELQRKGVTAGADVEITKAKAAEQIQTDRVRTAADIEMDDHSTRAEIIRKNVMAANEPKKPEATKKAKKK